MKIHYKIAGVIIQNGKLLMCRKYDEPHWIMPGGKRKKGESKVECLARELKEETHLRLREARYWDTYEAKHFNRQKKSAIRKPTRR